ARRRLRPGPRERIGRPSPGHAGSPGVAPPAAHRLDQAQHHAGAGLRPLAAGLSRHGWAIGVCDHVSGLLRDSHYRGLPVHTVRLRVDTDHFRPAVPDESRQARMELLGEIPVGTLVLGSVGGTDRAKGWMTLVQALARLPQSDRDRFRLLVAGDPPRGTLRQEVEALGMAPWTVFPGLVADPRRVLAASDVGFV